jgi:hypothetical protein
METDDKLTGDLKAILEEAKRLKALTDKYGMVNMPKLTLISGIDSIIALLEKHLKV